MGRLLLVLVAAAAMILPARAQTPGTPPLPDRDTFLADARKHLASNALLQSRFFFHEHVTGVRMNPFGAMGTGPEELYEVYPVAGEQLTYRRLIERGGVPLPGAELSAQDRKFLARYTEWQREVAREGQNERDARLKREAAAREKDRVRSEDSISLFDFTLERRDTLNGEPVIVVRFAQKPGAQPRTREARIASSFAGQAWVHETEHEVMRVEADAVADTIFGFGVIARLHKGAKAVFTRGRVGSVWLPLETRVTGTGRAILFRQVTFNYVRRYSDYRPFDPAALSALLAASAGNK